MALIKCPECGKEISDRALSCPNCGCPVEISNQPQKCEPENGPDLNENKDESDNPNVTGTPTGDSDDVSEARKKKRTAIIAIAAAAIVVILAITIFPVVFASVDSLCAKGDYERAYKKASDEEKPYIIAENIAAYLSSDISDNLKDPESFVLRNAYYYEDMQQISFYISANNSYGAKVGGYWVYYYNDDDRAFKLFGTVSDLDEEEITDYDDEEESAEKLLNNLYRATVELDMEYGIELSDDQVERINTMFENGTLKEVELLDLDFPKDSPFASSDSSSESSSTLVPESTAPTYTPTTGESNALNKAKDYLDVMAFSYSGLIDQLEYEGFTTEEATYGVDNCGADWNEQAAKKASDYLDLMSFSRDGLIEQLEYEGFTYDQAVYGVEANGY